MNYFLKIKSYGFKKVPSIVICDYNREKIDGKYITGFYIKKLGDIEANDKIVSPRPILMFGDKTSDVNLVKELKYHTFQYKLSDTLSLYIILIRMEYILIVKNDEEPTIQTNYRDERRDVLVPIRCNKITDSFWREILSALDTNVKRELLIRSII